MRVTNTSGRPTVEIPRPIEQHAVIGDLATIALVATDGAIDFLCWPDFDSPTIFAALLDPDRGGVFEVAPQLADARVTQQYLPDTNVVLTRWMSDEASCELTDFMYVRDKSRGGATQIVRRFKVTRGTVSVKIRCAPRFDYARQKIKPTIDDGVAVWNQESREVVRLASTMPLSDEDGDASAAHTLGVGEKVEFVLDDGTGEIVAEGDLDLWQKDTVDFWQGWAARSTYRGRWREIVSRSALTLKLMTSRRYGSVIAAATFGLPETPGGVRNWDYRATWIRDASFTVYALMRLGYRFEAEEFGRWVGERASRGGEVGDLKIMYSVDGTDVPEEVELDHLRGYGGAVPVRIGNKAVEQFQLDIYGELLDSLYLSNKYGHAISHDDWEGVCRVLDFVCDRWREPDAGIWEMRREPQEFLHSRLMCWVALDRGLRLAGKRSLSAPFARWQQARDDIRKDIWANFWNSEKGHFVQTKSGEALDASLLLMPLMRFVSATDPRWLSTLDAIGEQLVDDCLVMRYLRGDGLYGKEGAFSACSFWYAECLARAGRTAEARKVFEAVLNYANHVGLYAEEFDARGRLAGNFPQAFTHLALISAAFYIDRELDDANKQEWRP